MTLRNPRLLLVCFGILVAAFAAWSLRYFSRYQPLSALANGGVLNGAGQFSLEADSVQVVGRSGGKLHWRLGAQTVTLSRDRRIVSVTGIRRGTLYAQTGKPSVLLSADRAVYETPFGVVGSGSLGGSLEVSGHVLARVLSAEHPVFRTDRLRWDSAANDLSCPQSVSAALPRLSVTAGSADYAAPGALDQGSLHLSGGVHARVNTSRGVAILDCPGLSWTAAGQSVQTLGPVTAQIPGGLGTATAAAITVDTRTGDLMSDDLRVTLRVSQEVQ